MQHAECEHLTNSPHWSMFLRCQRLSTYPCSHSAPAPTPHYCPGNHSSQIQWKMQCLQNPALPVSSIFSFNVMAIGFSDHYAQILELYVEQGEARSTGTYKVGRLYKEENVHYLNYLLQRETWETVFEQTTVNTAFLEFMDTFKYYYEVAMPKVKIQSKQQRNKWITSGIRESSKRLRFLSKIMKSRDVDKKFQDYYHLYKSTYKKVIHKAKILHNESYINSSRNK